jgi:glycosyltransferase involved in cell wall biosynthesis
MPFMRIMPILAGAPEGGAETFFVDLCAAFARAGVEVRPVLRPNPTREAGLEAAGLSPRRLPFGRWTDRTTGRGLRAAVRRDSPDVVLAFMNRAASWMPPGAHLSAARLGGYYDVKYYRRCDHVLCITPDIRRHVLAQGWPEARAHVMPNFATIDTHPPQDRAALDTPADAPVLLVPSRLHTAKGLDVMLRALVRVPEAILWLAGDGPERSALATLADELGVARRVRFLGWRADKGALFRAADVVVFPSRYEPFGTVSLEAWAYGRPLVTTDAAGPAGLVTPGEDALMVPREDSDALAGAIRRCLDDPALAQDLVAAGQARYHEGYTEAACVARYLDLFKRLTADTARPERASTRDMA